jgi:hypothetical protein
LKDHRTLAQTIALWGDHRTLGRPSHFGVLHIYIIIHATTIAVIHLYTPPHIHILGISSTLGRE